jgi:hypothetical protein
MVTDGRRHWRVDLVPGRVGTPGLAHFPQHPPPAMADLWITGTEGIDALAGPDLRAGPMNGLMAGTRVVTSTGPVPVEHIRPGTEVVTADWGLAQVARNRVVEVSGARLCAMPTVRPVRVSGGALGAGMPSAGLIVGPDQGLVIDGPEVRALYPQGPVIVAAQDLVAVDGIGRVDGLTAVRLVVLELDLPACVMAEGVAVAMGGGDHLRRIGRGEAAILLAAMAGRVA